MAIARTPKIFISGQIAMSERNTGTLLTGIIKNSTSISIFKKSKYKEGKIFKFNAY
jgi:hypothetical protein